MSSTVIKVGTDKSGYANERNISGLPFEHCKVVRANNLFRLPNYAWFKLSGSINHYLANLHWMPGGENCELYHFFNGISLGKTPWVSTFETYLPRWGAYGYKAIRPGLKRLAGAPCKALLALSENAANIQEIYLNDHPEFASAILPKVQVLHPSQPALLDNFDAKPLPGDKINLCLVGADFFRKGGLEALKVVDRLLQKGAPFQLHIVSSLQFGDYASHSGQEELELAKKLISAHPQNIVHHSRLSNPDVLQLLSKCQIGLLPTWADTYGYSVLEAQAAGCPVISTNVRALPEINSNELGWIVKVKKDDWGNAILNSEKDRKMISESIEEQLEAILQDIWTYPATIQQKGHLSLQRIQEKHSPTSNAAFLENLYREILGKT